MKGDKKVLEEKLKNTIIILNKQQNHVPDKAWTRWNGTVNDRRAIHANRNTRPILRRGDVLQKENYFSAASIIKILNNFLIHRACIGDHLRVSTAHWSYINLIRTIIISALQRTGIPTNYITDHIFRVCVYIYIFVI